MLSVVTTATVRFVVVLVVGLVYLVAVIVLVFFTAVKSRFVEGGVIHIVVFLITCFILRYTQCVTVLTKSKRCPKNLDT